ncbi:MAG: SDR family oxidoreductase [Halopseudomonas sp.]
MSEQLFDLNGRVALVTGASRGIGASVARLLAEKGAQVIVSSRTLEDCQTVAAEIVAAGGKAEGFACHVGDMDQIEQLYQFIDERYGKIDILVNNAATNPYYGHILDTGLTAFDKTIDVNMRGYFFMSTNAGRRMRDSGNGGVILNVASVAALSPPDKQGIYSMTKAAVISMTKAFAKECGPMGIRVNALLPGFTDTQFTAALKDNTKVRDAIMRQIPQGRMGLPEEMAAAVLYLVSDASAYTNGASLVVDGGVMA